MQEILHPKIPSPFPKNGSFTPIPCHPNSMSSDLGFLNLNKPAGWTSHDCVAKVRKLLKLKRVGHAGTLDPTATGVLPIALGRATRLLQFLASDKCYRATLRFGLMTDTDDLEGQILSQAAADTLSLEKIQAALPAFRGNIQQYPPHYSAVQVGGKRLYELARAGKPAAEIPLRAVTVHRLDMLDWRPGQFPELDLEICCSAGTYIRSIARDLGKSLGCGGTLAALLRTESSGFALADSMNIEALEQSIQTGAFQPIPPEMLLAHLPAIALPPPLAKRWCQGQKLPWEGENPPGDPVRVFLQDGPFLGIGEWRDRNAEDEPMRLAPKVVLSPL